MSSVLIQDYLGRWWMVNGVWRKQITNARANSWIWLGVDAYHNSNDPGFRDLLYHSTDPTH